MYVKYILKVVCLQRIDSSFQSHKMTDIVLILILQIKTLMQCDVNGSQC